MYIYVCIYIYRAFPTGANGGKVQSPPPKNLLIPHNLKKISPLRLPLPSSTKFLSPPPATIN